MSLTPATSYVRLSRGGEFYVQCMKLTDADGNNITANRIIIEESRGAVAGFCCHWLEELLRKNETPLAERLLQVRDEFGRTARALSGDNPIGIFTVRKVALLQYVQLDFRVLEPEYATAHVGCGNLGIIKEIRPQQPHALPRTKRRQFT